METSVSRQGSVTPQLVLGLFIVVIGVLFTLDNMGVLSVDPYWRYWPSGLVVVGLLKLWQARGGLEGSFAGLLFVVVGGLLLFGEFADVHVNVWGLWPILLVFIGASMILRGVQGGRQVARPGDANDTVSAVAILGGVTRGNNSRTFRGGDLTAVMGGCEIDLRKAAIEGEAVIEVFAMWGGIDIRVPEDWTVVSRVTPLLGGVDDKTRPPQSAGGPRLVVRGFAIMGGIEIKN